MTGKTHYEILQVSPSATSDEIRKAYHKLARQHHPDRFRDPEEKRRAEETFTAMTDAFNVLTDSARRAEYDRSLREKPAAAGENSAQREAKAYARLAQARLQEGDAKEAVRLARAATHLDPAQASHWALLAQAAEADRAFGEAVKAWDEVIKRESFNGKWYRLAGQCLERARMPLRARKMYEQAIKWDRGDGVSAEALRRLTAADDKGEGKKGLLGGLFKRS